jgi:hypothetical protein
LASFTDDAANLHMRELRQIKKSKTNFKRHSNGPVPEAFGTTKILYGYHKKQNFIQKTFAHFFADNFFLFFFFNGGEISIKFCVF